jgi:hypothetical protein
MVWRFGMAGAVGAAAGMAALAMALIAIDARSAAVHARHQVNVFRVFPVMHLNVQFHEGLRLFHWLHLDCYFVVLGDDILSIFRGNLYFCILAGKQTLKRYREV